MTVRTPASVVGYLPSAVRHEVQRRIEISNQHPRLRLDRRGLTAAIAALDTHASGFLGGCPHGELSIAFVSDSQLALLHGEFLDDPSPTDVITFPGQPDLGVAGEICVSVDAARRQARSARSGQATFGRELLLYVVHGWLHLAGYDDRSPVRKRVMRRAERRAMEAIDAAKANPRLRLSAG